MSYIPDIEKQPLSVIKSFQEQKLKDTLTYIQQNSKYYQQLFEQNKIDINTIHTLEDFRKNTHN
jgi:phenylacetate-CoA ligase